jgi:hypothetical protein
MLDEGFQRLAGDLDGQGLVAAGRGGHRGFRRLGQAGEVAGRNRAARPDVMFTSRRSNLAA